MLPIHQHRLEASLEHMPDLPMPAVVRLRVHPIEMPHQSRQIRLPREQQQLVMLAPQPVGQHLGIEALGGLLDQTEHRQPVLVVREHGRITTRRHVINGAGELDAKRPGHAQ